jgi:hypothetical protein
MATSRPLMQLGISDLEGLFSKGQTDLTTLSRLRHELSHRQVPKAIALLEKVTAAESKLTESGPNGNPVNSQAKAEPLGAVQSNHSLESGPTRRITRPGLAAMPSIQPDLLSALAEVTAVTAPQPTIKAQPPKAEQGAKVKGDVPSEPFALPQLALSDAYRILKVGAGDQWEKIEAQRRLLVSKSNPIATQGLTAATVQKLRSDAKLANDAALVIAARRCGRQ